jgi:hypothetical protein
LLQPETVEPCGNVRARGHCRAALSYPELWVRANIQRGLRSHGQATQHVAIAGGEQPSMGERYAKAGHWPGRRLVGFGSQAVKLSVSIYSLDCPR